jgi:phytanoyl-CoA hydroxylase
MSATLATTCPSHTDRAAFAAFFAENGYAIARGVVSGAQLADLQHEFDRVVDQLERLEPGCNNARWGHPATARIDGGSPTVVVHTHQIQQYSGAWSRFCFDNTFLDACEPLLGEDIILHHTKLFLKPAGIGAPFPPHQDWSYFPADQDHMLAAVVAMSEANEDNGCIRVWPGSHRRGRLARSNGEGDFDRDFPFADSVPGILEPGDVLFFDYLTVHGSLPNRGEHARKSVLFQLHSGNDLVEDKNRHLNSQLVLRGWNHRMHRSLVR